MPTLLRERYEVLESRGPGGEGRVVKALDCQHARLVALKIRPVRGDQARDPVLNEDRVRGAAVYGRAAAGGGRWQGAAPGAVVPSWEGWDAGVAGEVEAATGSGMAAAPERRPAAPAELVERLRAGSAAALPTGVVTF